VTRIDLELALRKIHELSADDGDLGHEYWSEVGRLLKAEGDMQVEVAALRADLERCRLRLARVDRG
jgi:hypothetical protein